MPYFRTVKISLSLLLCLGLASLAGCPLPDRAKDDEPAPVVDNGLPVVQVRFLTFDPATNGFPELLPDSSGDTYTLSEAKVDGVNPRVVLVAFNLVGTYPQLEVDQVVSVTMKIPDNLSAKPVEDFVVHESSVETTIIFPNPDAPPSTVPNLACPEPIRIAAAADNCRIIEILDDTVYEKQAIVVNNRIEEVRREAFAVTFTSPVNLRLPVPSPDHLFYITDDDPEPFISLSLPDYLLNGGVYEISESQPAIPFVVTLSGTSTEWPIFIPLTYSGTAESGVDYIPLESFTYTPRDKSGLLNTQLTGYILLSDDILGEADDDDTLTITMAAPKADAQLLPGGVGTSVTIKILDNEGSGLLNPTLSNRCVDPTKDSSSIAFDKTTAVVDCATYTTVNNQDGHQSAGASMSLTVMTPDECAYDASTGLVWELKQQAQAGFVRQNYVYTWYNEAPHSNGGQPGGEGHSADKCGNIPGLCNTTDYVAMVNGLGLCGYHDWRLPTAVELFGLTSFTQFLTAQPRIPSEFYRVMENPYWTSTPVAGDPTKAWAVDFASGRLVSMEKYDSSSTAVKGAGIMLVRARSPGEVLP